MPISTVIDLETTRGDWKASIKFRGDSPGHISPRLIFNLKNTQAVKRHENAYGSQKRAIDVVLEDVTELDSLIAMLQELRDGYEDLSD